MKITIKEKGKNVVFNSQTSKQEELNFLNALCVEFAGTQTYLASLFTGRLLQWASRRIQDDFPIDVMEQLDATNNESNKKDQYINTLEAKLYDTEKLLKEKNDTINNALNEINVLKQDLRDEKQKGYGLACQKGERVLELEGQLREAAQHQRQADDTIIKLKVKLFDLQNKEN